MVEIRMTYAGSLRVEATHGPSGTTLHTDAPVDNYGKGESFSPTDLVATALGACMATIMGIAAERHDVSLEGMTIDVQKHMATEPVRRIGKLVVRIGVPHDPGGVCVSHLHPRRKLRLVEEVRAPHRVERRGRGVLGDLQPAFELFGR